MTQMAADQNTNSPVAECGGFLSRLLLAFALLANLAAAGCKGACDATLVVPIELRSQYTPLSADDPSLRRVGALEHRGGLLLTSTDARFGGLSGLLVSPGGDSFVAISDRGFWIEGGLVYENDVLAGVTGGTLRHLLDERGRCLQGDWADAEGLVRVPERGAEVLVSFERRARILRYDLDISPRRAVPVLPFDGLSAVEYNRGLEAIEFLADGSLLAITEASRNPAGDVIGWLREPGGDRAISLRLEKGWGVTSLARLAGGDLLTLERWFRPPADLRIRLRRLAASDLRAGEPLDAPVVAQFGRGHTMDNMEGLDIRHRGDRAFVYMLSDDNYNPLQRTILHMFEWIADN